MQRRAVISFDQKTSAKVVHDILNDLLAPWCNGQGNQALSRIEGRDNRKALVCFEYETEDVYSASINAKIFLNGFHLNKSGLILFFFHCRKGYGTIFGSGRPFLFLFHQ